MSDTPPRASGRGIRLVKRALCAALVLCAINYGFAARGRAHAGETTGGWDVEISDTHAGAYTVRYALIHRSDMLLRLYRTGDPTLLAERTHEAHGVALTWTEDKLIYDTSIDDGMIDLPPTSIDRLLAWLP